MLKQLSNNKIYYFITKFSRNISENLLFTLYNQIQDWLNGLYVLHTFANEVSTVSAVSSFTMTAINYLQNKYIFRRLLKTSLYYRVKHKSLKKCCNCSATL